MLEMGLLDGKLLCFSVHNIFLLMLYSITFAKKRRIKKYGQIEQNVVDIDMSSFTNESCYTSVLWHLFDTTDHKYDSELAAIPGSI